MAGSSKSPAIRVERLRALFDGVNAFGKSEETGGFNRRAFSDADMEARRWFAGEMENAGLDVRWDGAGNLFGRWGAGDAPVIMAGSHLDTVLEGGAFDGTLGACVAFESVRALKEAGVEPKVPVEIVATSDEEGRFGGMLGSQAIAGVVTQEWIDRAVDADGVTLADAMTAQHLHPAAIRDAACAKGSIGAFLELHIEQGPVLKANGKAVGIVESVSGLCNWQVTLTGIANHSGTTPMDMRSDAFAGLAEIAATIPSIIRIVGRENTRVTVGKVDITPNHTHTIPGKAVFNLIIRDPDEGVMRSIAAAFRSLIERIAGNRALTHSIDQMSWLSPATLDASLTDRMESEAKRLGLDAVRMVSGAGHDAQTMQSACPSALIFVPSEGGISHAPQERTEWDDIEKGAALYLATLHSLCMDGAGLTPASAAATPAAIAGQDAEETLPVEPSGAHDEPDDAIHGGSEDVTVETGADPVRSEASGDDESVSQDEPDPARPDDAVDADDVPADRPAETTDEKTSEDASASAKPGKKTDIEDDMDFDFDFGDLIPEDRK